MSKIWMGGSLYFYMTGGGVFLNNIFILSHLLGLKMFNIRLWKTNEILCAKEIEMDLASWKRIHVVKTPRGRNFIDLALYSPLER